MPTTFPSPLRPCKSGRGTASAWGSRSGGTPEEGSPGRRSGRLRARAGAGAHETRSDQAVETRRTKRIQRISDKVSRSDQAVEACVGVKQRTRALRTRAKAVLERPRAGQGARIAKAVEGHGGRTTVCDWALCPGARQRLRARLCRPHARMRILESARLRASPCVCMPENVYLFARMCMCVRAPRWLMRALHVNLGRNVRAHVRACMR